MTMFVTKDRTTPQS